MSQMIESSALHLSVDISYFSLFLCSFHFYTIHSGNDAAQSTAIVYGPLNTARMSDVERFLNETDEDLRELPNETLLSFKVHLPLDEAASSGGT